MKYFMKLRAMNMGEETWIKTEAWDNFFKEYVKLHDELKEACEESAAVYFNLAVSERNKDWNPLSHSLALKILNHFKIGN